jgi:predicted helicase
LTRKYGFVDVRDWTIDDAKKDLRNNKIVAEEILYRPFDVRFMNYTGKTKGVMGYPRYDVMKHFILGENVGLVASRQFGGHERFILLMTNKPIEISSQPFAPYSVFPLYLYSDPTTPRIPNLDLKIVENIAQAIKMKFEEEKSDSPKKFAPIDLSDYVYAVLHSPTYREKYKEFLKIDFPRVPYPEDAKKFRKLASLGEKLRLLHLMEGVEPRQGLANYDVEGKNVVEKIEYNNDKVWINATQFFDNVPSAVWNFFIGGYQVAQKWLKDRKGRSLDYDDIRHYRTIIHILKETQTIMYKIDESME